MSYDYVRSLAIAERVLTIPKCCWANSVRALRRQKGVRGGLYVEGLMEYIPGLLMEHGWIELPDGTIIDTTRAYLMKYHGHEPDSRIYYPVQKYTLASLKGVRVAQLPLAWIEMSIFQFEHLPAEIQEPFLKGRPLQAYLDEMREFLAR
jgi:hypothetical protein